MPPVGTHDGGETVLSGDAGVLLGQPFEMDLGQTVEYMEPVEANPVEQLDSLKQLTRDMQSGAVDLLVVDSAAAAIEGHFVDIREWS